MQARSASPYLIIPLMLCAPFAATPGVIEVNGVCVNGVGAPITCTVDSLSNGDSTGLVPFNFDTSVNGDEYNISGTYSAAYSKAHGGAISVDPTVVYVGTSDTAQEDVLTFDFLQDFYDPGPGTWAGTYEESVPLSLSPLAPAGSSVEGQLYVDSPNTVGLVGPYGPGSRVINKSATLDLDDSPTLSLDYDFVFTFAASTPGGVGASSPSTSSIVPEPAMAIPCGLAFILFSYQVRRRNRGQSGRYHTV
jgi:hypothetical protein